MNQETLKNVRAVDVGYGNVKFTLHHPTFKSPIECSIFPSRSPAASSKSLSAGILTNPRTVTVQVGNTEYEVGYDVALAQSTHDDGAVLDKLFCFSEHYMARLLGAMHYMLNSKSPSGEPHMANNMIDCLVLGLPVATYKEEGVVEKLRLSLSNTEHKYPNGQTIRLGDVRVVPQPLGAFYEYAIQSDKMEQLARQQTLIIDPGFFTFDWLWCNGMKPSGIRSGSVNHGMSSVIKSMAEAIKKNELPPTADPNTVARMLDEHFCKGEPFSPYGKELDVNKYLEHGQPTVSSALAALTSKVGDGIDIHNIILTGGGAEFYLNAIQEKFPGHNIVVTDSPVFSNVRGFHLAGESWASSAVVKTRKDERAAAVAA